jgi:hypothetical protein
VFFAQTKVVVGTTLPPSLSHSFGVQRVSKESNKEINPLFFLSFYTFFFNFSSWKFLRLAWKFAKEKID